MTEPKDLEIDKAAGEQSEKKRRLRLRWTLSYKQRMFVLLFVLWAAIGYLDLNNLVLGNAYPVSVLYVLVILPAAVEFGWTGLGIATFAVIVMYHFTNDKSGVTSYHETEVMRLAFVVLLGVGFERVSRDRERIRTALEELQHAVKVREDLTHMLVHDLRTPLTGIITSLQTLQMGVLGELDADQKEMVDFATSDGQRLLEMVNQILDVSRLEAGEMPLRLQQVEVAEVADGALRVVQPIAAESGVHLVQSCNGLKANLDPDLMKRVLVNLLGNAVKFTPKDGEVTVLSRPDHEGEAHIIVKDTGWGIPEADLKRVFEKYAQTKAGAKKTQSTGIGLTFCRLAVEAHGGRIWAESEVGKGTEMHILIPQDGPEGKAAEASRN